MNRTLLLWLWALACVGLASATHAAPYLPKSDSQVLETLPQRASTPRQREMSSLRSALVREPANATLAVQLVDRYLVELAAEGDPRYVGYALAALAPWWKSAEPPLEVRVKRAVLLQFNHQFEPAVADLQAVVQQQGEHAQAWAWLAAIAMVQARYPQARQACERVAELSSELIGSACLAQVDATTGSAVPAIADLQQALRDEADAPAEERLWALTRLAEAQERIGDTRAAESSFREALALGVEDSYLRAAHADFLLDQGRGAEVLVALKDKGRTDVLLLRLALAAKATGDGSLARHSAAPAPRPYAPHPHGNPSQRRGTFCTAGAG
jgi:tetratricopeptide (TPR) repeat protein